MNEWLQYIFGFTTDPKNAFFFNRYDFWVFFTVVLFFFSLLYRKKRIRNVYLLIISLFFYYKSGGFYFFLLLFSTLVDFFIGRKIYRSRNQRYRKSLLALSIVINLGVLAYFKYGYFIVDNLNAALGTHWQAVDVFALMANNLTGAHFDIASIFLPIGISFYTFQTISYSVDVYRGLVRPVRNILDFAFYVSFFPQLVAGPIVRAADFVPQIYKSYRVTREEMGRGLFLITIGMIKKILIADYLGAHFVGRVFAEPLKYSGFENLTAVYGFALQIYGDFSGYTDIAIGIALLLGFRLPLNFNAPYKAVNITDFWRRWHISLSSWLRDYLYIPLGGNRHGKFNTYKNLMITMLLGGLWHGAAWRFIFWGGMHGLGLGVNKAWREWIDERLPVTHLSKVLWGIVTFHFVCFCWVFFAASDMNSAWEMLGRIAGAFYWEKIPEVISAYRNIFIILIFAMAVHLLPRQWKEGYTRFFIDLPDPVKALAMAAVAFGLYQVMSSEVQPFIYFQF